MLRMQFVHLMEQLFVECVFELSMRLERSAQSHGIEEEVVVVVAQVVEARRAMILVHAGAHLIQMIGVSHVMNEGTTHMTVHAQEAVDSLEDIKDQLPDLVQETVETASAATVAVQAGRHHAEAVVVVTVVGHRGAVHHEEADRIRKCVHCSDMTCPPGICYSNCCYSVRTVAKYFGICLVCLQPVSE